MGLFPVQPGFGPNSLPTDSVVLSQVYQLLVVADDFCPDYAHLTMMNCIGSHEYYFSFTVTLTSTLYYCAVCQAVQLSFLRMTGGFVYM